MSRIRSKAEVSACTAEDRAPRAEPRAHSAEDSSCCAEARAEYDRKLKYPRLSRKIVLPAPNPAPTPLKIRPVALNPPPHPYPKTIKLILTVILEWDTM